MTPSQRTIYQHLRDNKNGITQAQAWRLFRESRLAARIFELKEQNWQIDGVMEKNDRTGKSYKRYWLASKRRKKQQLDLI